MIEVRDYRWNDFARAREIFLQQGLPIQCMPDLIIEKRRKPVFNPRFVVKKVAEDGAGNVAMMGFVKVTSEAFLLLDHKMRDPLWRWEALQEMVEVMAEEAKRKGLDCVTAWIPDDLVNTFGPRMEALKFIRSPWVSFSRLL